MIRQPSYTTFTASWLSVEASWHIMRLCFFYCIWVGVSRLTTILIYTELCSGVTVLKG